MIHTIPFVKCSGAGNDFVLIDNMHGKVNVPFDDLARALCSRPFGIGGDGLLVIEPSESADFMMRYYNADGSYGGMCGNGGRCIAMYAIRAKHAKSPLTFDALDYRYKAELLGQEIRLHMRNPEGFREVEEVRGAVPGSEGTPVFLDTGAPHLIIKVRDVERVDVQSLGRGLRNHAAFAPGGTNVNFVQIQGPSSVRLRTYERGVEAETLACGTGSVASAAACVVQWGCKPPVDVHVQSGEIVSADFEHQGQTITNVSLQGSAHILFRANAFYDDSSHAIYGDISE